MKVSWKRLGLRNSRRLTAGGLRHDAPRPIDGGLLVHRIQGEGGSGLVLTDQKGRLVKPLVIDRGEHGPPSPLPDGSLVFYAYRQDPESRWQIRSVRPDSGEGGILIEGPTTSFLDPVPVVARGLVVFASDEGSAGTFHLWQLDPTAPGRKPLASSPEGSDDQPAASPSGRYLAFRRRVGEEAQIFLYDFESGEQRPLTAAPGSSERPCFVDEYRIVFHRNLPGGDQGLLLLDTLECREQWITGVVEKAADPAVLTGRKGKVVLFHSQLGEAAGPEAEPSRDVYRSRLRGVGAEEKR